MKEIVCQYDKRIRVYDALFDFHYRADVYSFAQKSYFSIGWADGAIVEKQANRFLHSVYSEDDVGRLGILKKIAESEAAGELDGYKLTNTILNLSTASDTNYVHTHPEDKVLLYYVNLEWFDGWHGETLFFSEDHKDVAFASPYTPGRLISFDAKIPHTIRPQSHIAAQYRFTLTLIFNKQ
ncbi:MAG: hypothetical protein ACK5DE_09660 [Bacteroidota bacterium]|jgi:hypothetical protein